MRTRRLISASLLLVQAFVFHHAAFSSHVVDDSGLAFEAVALATDSHEADSHLCSDLALADSDEQACPVLAAFSAPAVVLPSASVVAPPAPRSLAVEGVQCAVAPLSPLSLAPKSSPPARA